jgi:hypothetical protein
MDGDSTRVTCGVRKRRQRKKEGGKRGRVKEEGSRKGRIEKKRNRREKRRDRK